MSTSSRPRRAGARASAAVLATLAATGATMISAPAAVAAPGDPDVKIHRVGLPFSSQRSQPNVCDFYLAAFNFRAGQSIAWTIDKLPPAAVPAPVAEGAIVLGVDGTGHTPPVTPEGAVRFQEGDYRLTWRIVGETAAPKFKDFNVDCPVAPNGGPPAGGGGLAMTQDFSPVAGAAAVGVAAVGGVAYLRLRRRRADGAA
ncbi:hypothetical protein [Streptomyces sp. HM190]|uniref:hypothetical protein n=1 Tax=Streptomyces sp. HM190 TaxID=2695266 RepID=UPI00135A8A8E|nr:hypothetical protein [Streptomyces sp. HM190]